MTNKEKAEFCRYVRTRQNDVAIAAKHDIGVMNGVVSMLPKVPEKLTEKQAIRIMRDIERCDLVFIDEDKEAVDEQWRQDFFS